MAVTHGFTEPRVFTKPLRELTPETSRGFEAIDFALNYLKVVLFPWEEWLLIHLMELNPDGTLRFRKALVIVARQNGKTLVGAVLAAFWLYVDAGRWPNQLREDTFVVVGAAQKLDIAMKPWRQVRQWGGPDDPKIGIAADRVPFLQQFTYMPRMTNGEISLKTHTGAQYLPRTFDGARGHSAARLLLDELRQQYDYEGWSAIEKSANAMFDSLLVAFTNAGTARSKVLRDVRDIATEDIEDPDTEWFLAEWSGHPDASLDDERAFAQANPSAGYLPGMTIAGLMRTAAKAKEKAVERIEVLCQWVTAEITPYFDYAGWAAAADPEVVNERGEVVEPGSALPPERRAVLGVDVAGDRKTTSVTVAGYRNDGLIHMETIAQRAGIPWVIQYLVDVRAATGINEVALQGRGCAASDLADPLKRAGFTVHAIAGTELLNTAGRMHDAISEDRVRHRSQPSLDMAIENTVTKLLNGMPVLDREKAPVDISPAAAGAFALYALEQKPPEEKKPQAPPPPPPVAIVSEGNAYDIDAPSWLDSD